MSKRTLLGLLTPSSNTILEPLTAEVLADSPEVSAHFNRFRVTEISMSERALEQFGFEPQLQASDLLKDANVDVIAWAGTSGSWVGIEHDRELCRQITERTGIAATTSTLALLEALKFLGVSSYALVTPYLDEIQGEIVANFKAMGFACRDERHLGDRGNFSFSEFPESVIEAMLRDVAQSEPQAIAIHCTNFLGTRIAPRLEQELGIPVIDSVSVTLWHMLKIAGIATERFGRWGRIFSQT